ncbi:uncharacterized protein EI90DRAFT_3045474 [Cantharellus anzutake]|uniref:uncharacterized protein n=1 Tax=Cantharellus anzutake TaxID=1750568 RepID=UPI00190406A4|nr:uncharacterized protein EI90DRAFT_3045474 [Cantharellus anzutake]KAF8336354.1 hypothetical protein EI90DRAFT_3045474 [Cantharellus anzutake]
MPHCRVALAGRVFKSDVYHSIYVGRTFGVFVNSEVNPNYQSPNFNCSGPLSRKHVAKRPSSGGFACFFDNSDPFT